MGRPQKYDWEDKREICWKLYNEDRLSGNQIVQHFVEHFKLPESDLPTSNQFYRQFKLWGFPPRRPFLTPEQEAKLVGRIRELYNQNLQVQDIQDKVNEEGWELDNYHFRALRKKYGLMKRNLAGYQPYETGKKRKQPGDGDTGDAEADVAVGEGSPAHNGGTQRPPPPSLPPEETARRVQRLADLQVESDQLMANRKRRRRIRGYGHMGPDAPGLAPRFNSETSLDECKVFLLLSNEVYTQIRDQFEAICSEQGIKKMTECAEGQWQAAKDKLVRENSHLSSVLNPLQPDQDRKSIALNCICADVTKKIRSMSRSITMADANNILGLDPLQSKELRRQLYDILEADHFTTVAACGKERLDQLKEQWCAQSELLSRAMAENDPLKVRAIHVLDRDTRKRFGDDPNKNPGRQQQKHYGPGPGPAKSTNRSRRGLVSHTTTLNNTAAVPTTTAQTTMDRPTTTYATARRRQIAPVGPAWTGQPVPEFHSTTIADLVPPINFDIDPALESLARPRSGGIWPPTESLEMADRIMSSGNSVIGGQAPSSTAQSVSIPAYFRLAPTSTLIGHHPHMWLGKLSSRTLAGVQQAATAKAGAARVAKVHGVVKNADGSEDSWLIESDDELEVYLEEAGEKATFAVMLEGGYA
jgi:hypothetical protein